MPVFIDQTGRTVTLDEAPQKIISIVPSQTELLYDLGLRDEVTGITKFCIHPDEWFRSKVRVGGTKQLKMDIIHQLAPDLIIANKEENVRGQIEELQKSYPIWVSDVNNLADAYEMIDQIGLLTNRVDKARIIIASIRDSFAQLTPLQPRPRTAYLIWQNPHMTVGGDTFIHSMMDTAGLENIYKNETRYPEISLDDLQKKNCQLLLLSSEPFPFKDKHIKHLKPLLPETKILLADGELFSWYGSRMRKFPDYLKSLKKIITNR